jgi:hypothetical protein
MESSGKVGPPCCAVEDVEASFSFDEVIQILEAPAKEEESKVSCLPSQIFNDSLPCDVESEEVLYNFTPSCYNDFVDNIEDFIHVEKHNWDIIGYDGDPIYDIEGHVQEFPLPLSHEVTNEFDIWQEEHDMITNFIQTPKGDLM